MIFDYLNLVLKKICFAMASVLNKPRKKRNKFDIFYGLKTRKFLKNKNKQINFIFTFDENDNNCN